MNSNKSLNLRIGISIVAVILLGIYIYFENFNKSVKIYKPEKSSEISEEPMTPEYVRSQPEGTVRREFPLWVSKIPIVYPDSTDPKTSELFAETIIIDSCLVAGDHKGEYIPMYETMYIEDDDKGKFWCIYRYYIGAETGKLMVEIDKEFFIFNIERKKVWYD